MGIFGVPQGLFRVFVRLFVGLPGLFMSRQVLLLSVLLRNAMGVRGFVVQFRGPLVVLVMRSIIVASGHNYRVPICPDLVWASFASL